MSFSTATIRNIALAGHGGTGKTTLTEHMLLAGGVISKTETVDSGKTVSDYTPEEIERSLSIHTTLSSMSWKDKKINILDTPGSSDFVGEVVVSFRSAESGIMLVSARDGVQIETIKLWRRLNQRNKPRLVYINKMDAERADFNKSFEDLKENFNKTIVPIVVPMGSGKGFKGVINLLSMKASFVNADTSEDELADIPAEFKEIADTFRLLLIESAAEGDEAIMEKYFETDTLSEDEIIQGLVAGIKANTLAPVLCGSAEQNCGVSMLLDFVSDICPSPEGVVEHGTDEEEKDVEYVVNENDKDVRVLVYKTTIDQFSGKLSFIKVITGTLTSDSELYDEQAQKKERISKIYSSVGKNLIEVKELHPGDLGILIKLDSVQTNHSLCTPGVHVRFDKLKLPQPVHTLTINAASKKDDDKMNDALHRVAAEDLTFQIGFNKETKENVISGMGELHINMILNKVKEKQKIEITTKIPRVAYRETVTKTAEAEYTHKKQSGGHGQYGKVVMQLNPLQRGDKYSFTNSIKGGSISKSYMPGIEKGLIEAMDEGYLAGYPIVDIGFTIVDGKEHPVDSSEMSFKLAAKGALREAMGKAKAALLEPVMRLSVFVNADNVGDILSDLSSRRGRVLGQEVVGGGITEVDALVPQSELLRYSIDLRSLTSGTGSFEMEFDHYDPISGKIADTIIAESKAVAQEV